MKGTEKCHEKANELIKTAQEGWILLTGTAATDQNSFWWAFLLFQTISICVYSVSEDELYMVKKPLMLSQQLAQESDSLWKLPSSGARAEGEETVLHLQTASLLLPNFKIKTTMATERHFYSSAEWYLSLQRNTHPLK